MRTIKQLSVQDVRHILIQHFAQQDLAVKNITVDITPAEYDPRGSSAASVSVSFEVEVEERSDR